MPEPKTMLALATAMSMGGDLIQGVGAYQDGKMQAAMSERAASDALRAGTMESNDRLAEGRRAVAAAKVAAGGSGFAIDGGALRVMEDLTTQAHGEAQKRLWSASSEARNRRFEGKLAKQKGKRALVATGLKMAASGANFGFQKSQLSKQGLG